MKYLSVLAGLTLFITSGSLLASASTVPDEHAALDLATKAMSALGTKGVRGVFETVGPYWNRTPVELNSVISDSEEKREVYKNSYGQYVGFEKISEKKVGSSLYMVTMLEKTEKKAVVWYFSFYKPKDAWIVWSCYWNPNFESLLLLSK